MAVVQGHYSVTGVRATVRQPKVGVPELQLPCAGEAALPRVHSPYSPVSPVFMRSQRLSFCQSVSQLAESLSPRRQVISPVAQPATSRVFVNRDKTLRHSMPYVTTAAEPLSARSRGSRKLTVPTVITGPLANGRTVRNAPSSKAMQCSSSPSSTPAPVAVAASLRAAVAPATIRRSQSVKQQLSTPSTIEYLTDVEGNWDYFLKFVEFSDALHWSGPGRGPWGPGTLELRAGCGLVFGGDAVDKGPGDIRFVKTMLDLRRRYPGRVWFVLGNRELNKLRFFAELAAGESGHNFLAYWDTKTETYASYRERLSLEDNLVTTLRWMLDCNMGCQKTTFETRRTELALLAGCQTDSVSDEVVVRSFRDSVDPCGDDPWMLDFLKAGQLAVVLGRSLYVHGGLYEEAIGRVPHEKAACTTVQDWATRLNAWKEAQLLDFVSRPAWRSEDTSSCHWDARGRRRGGDVLIDYGTPNGGKGVTVVYHNPLDNGNPQLCAPAVEDFLIKSGIRRVFTGHQPHGQSPCVIRQPRSGLMFVMADCSYSDMAACKQSNPADNRGMAVSVVKFCDDKVSVTGQLADGTKHHCEMHGDPRLDRLPDGLVGRQLEDGSWVKTVLEDGRLCVVRGEGFKLDMVHWEDSSKVQRSLKEEFALPPEVLQGRRPASSVELGDRIGRLWPGWQSAIERLVNAAESGALPHVLEEASALAVSTRPLATAGGPSIRVADTSNGHRSHPTVADVLSIGETLEAARAPSSSGLPREVEEMLAGLGFPQLLRCTRIKVSFHATFVLEFKGPLRKQAKEGNGKAILQLLGAELGDKTFFHLERPISAASIARASELAAELGILVPKVLATGCVAAWGPLEDVPFVVYEHISTETVEDEIAAPAEQWQTIYRDIRDRLAAKSMRGVDTEPLPRFEDCFAFIAYLRSLAKEVGAADLTDALRRLEKLLWDSGIQAIPPTLIHQDLNRGNILCSSTRGSADGQWHLDALIDWEGAAVGDHRICCERVEPWATLRKLANVTKCRWLAAKAAGAAPAGEAGQLPRCNAEELLEDYPQTCAELVRDGWLPELKVLPKLPL
eukprot:TRINITY_DN112906_c0_g1_i1.p1 TRINITY_DN112906_c0_g1~~TRINITY_DN112906_c0_g1_i1.p1  ORF type:complete len:1070 (-),score=199.36 TRINITY_DN112906_c0_g1_i1:368-3577(-)